MSLLTTSVASHFSHSSKGQSPYVISKAVCYLQCPRSQMHSYGITSDLSLGLWIGSSRNALPPAVCKSDKALASSLGSTVASPWSPALISLHEPQWAPPSLLASHLLDSAGLLTW
jgi:hypothetical protein